MGAFYDLGVGSAGDLTADFPNFASTFTPDIAAPLSDISPYLPTFSTQPPYSSFVKAFSPDLKLPRSYQWNAAVEKSLVASQVISATYVGQMGRGLLRATSEFQPNPNFQSDFQITNNGARSNYNALQLQYRKTVTTGLQALVNYSWSHSLDNASDDVVIALSNAVLSGSTDYASSDFDVRHSFSGALAYNSPGLHGPGAIRTITKDWSVNAMVVARSGFPFNAVVFSTSPDVGGSAVSRPDRVPGEPLWIKNATAPGGRSLNPAAFSLPSTIRQGTEGRNDIAGFGLTQVDLSIGRKISMTDRLALQFRVDAFNILNHPNFTNPLGLIEFGPNFLESTQMLNQGLGGLNPLFQEGGPRSLQLAAKVLF